MSLRPFFRNANTTREQRRHSVPDVLAFLRHAREQLGEPIQRGRTSESGPGRRPKTLRKSSSTPPATGESVSPTGPVNEPIFVHFDTSSSAGPSVQVLQLQNTPPAADDGLGLDILPDDDDDDADDLLVERLSSPSRSTNRVVAARVSYIRTSTDDSLEAYPVSPPGLPQPLPDEDARVAESYLAEVASSDPGDTWNAPDILIIAPEEDQESEVNSPTPVTIAEVPDMPDIAMKEEREYASRVHRDVAQMDYPPTPAAPRLPYITRFSFDPLYA